MAVTLNLPTDVEQHLKEKAARIGQTLEEFLQQLAVREVEVPEPKAAGPSIAYPQGYSPEERSKAIREWAESHPQVEHFVDDSRA